MLDARAADLEQASARITDSNTGESAPGSLRNARGHVIVFQSPIAFALGAIVKIEAQNHLWMGDVCACEPDSGGFALEIEVDAVLNDVAGVTRLASRFRQEKISGSMDSAEPEYASLNPRNTPKQIA